jgi:hypothetical protein
MMRTGRPKAVLIVTAEQRVELERLARRRTTAQALALRARIVLGMPKGGHNGKVAEDLVVTGQLVAVGARDSSSAEWTDCWTSLGWERRARSLMLRSRRR